MNGIEDLIRTVRLPASPDSTSPGGVAEIRNLLSFPAGELTHVRVPPGKVALPSRVHPSSEWFIVLSGHGQCWEGGSGRVVNLAPGWTIRIAPATPFQYRTFPDSELEIVLAAMPRWEPSFHGVLGKGNDGVGPWSATTDPEHIDDRGDLEPADRHGVQVLDPNSNDEERLFLTPDGMSIFRLGYEDAGGLALYTLQPDGIYSTELQTDVEEIWYVVSGDGRAIRRLGSEPPVDTALTAGTCIDISRQVTCQFDARADGLCMLVLTMPFLRDTRL